MASEKIPFGLLPNSSTVFLLGRREYVPVSVSSSLGTFSRSCPGLLGVVEQGDLGGIRGGGRERVGSPRRELPTQRALRQEHPRPTPSAVLASGF